MALQKTHNLKGLEVADAYHVVSDVRYDKIYNNVRFHIRTYTSSSIKETEPENYIDISTQTFYPTGSYSVIGNDISTACYTFLKTQDAWSGSVDV